MNLNNYAWYQPNPRGVMQTIRFHLIHGVTGGDDDWAARLAQDVNTDLAARKLDLTPKVVRSDFAAIPEPKDLGPLDSVVVVLPPAGSSFPKEAAERLRDLLDRFTGDRVRVLPLSREPARNQPPDPLSQVVSYHLHATAAADVARLASFLLIHAGLRVSGESRKVFVSYKLSDGKDLAVAVADGLKARGYGVWRDELSDRDGQPLIKPGSEAQKTIEKAILDHGFVLVLDTPQAQHSTWVHEEVRIAFSRLLPMLPLVVEDVANPGHPRSPGSRFKILDEMREEVRIAYDEQPDGPAKAVDDAFLDRLEAKMAQTLLRHVRSQWGVLEETRKALESLNFVWKPVASGRGLYHAYYDKRKAHPRFGIRLLIQCFPYDEVTLAAVSNVLGHFADSPDPCQYVVLVHPTPKNATDRDALLVLSRGHVLLLNPIDLPKLPSILNHP